MAVLVTHAQQATRHIRRNAGARGIEGAQPLYDHAQGS